MNRRRSSRLSSALDASFQIPLAVNSTANNLLLEDDALEQDFFDGFDYTITTPILTKPASSSLSPSTSEPQQDVRKPAQSDQKNFYHDDDYAEEEREVELGNDDLDETPRAKRVLTPLFGLSPTPRARETENGSNGSCTASRLPASISSSPFRSEYHFRRRKNSDISSSPTHGMPRSSKSPSATPKPDRRRNRSSLAPPSVHSTPVGAPVPSSASRSVKAHLRAQSREADTHTLDQEHAISSCDRSDFVSDADRGRGAGARGDRTTLASTRRLSSDPHSPGKPFVKASKPMRSKHPNSSHSRTRSSSPSPFSRVDHDAVMLPIQEEDEDLQDQDGQLSISKPQHNAAFSVPVDDLMEDNADVSVQRKSGVEGLGSGYLSSSTLRDNNAESRPASSPKLAEKRSGDSLASQPALKKRKTEANIPRRSRTSIEVGHSELPSGCVGPADASPISSTLTEVPVDDKVDAEEHVNSPIKSPIAPESESRPSSPYPLIESRSELPSGASNVGRAPHEANEEPDEVQDFLLRYAKKYRPGATSAANAVLVNPKKPTPTISEHIIKQAQADPSSKRHNATLEHGVPDIKRAQVKIRKPAANVDPKGKKVSRDTAAKTTVKRAPTDKLGVSKPRSVPNVKDNVCSIPEKPAPAVRTFDQLRATSSGPDIISPEALLTQPLAVPDSATIFPNANQLTVDLPPRQTRESSLDEGVARFRSTSADRDAIRESRRSEIPTECPVDSESVVPRPSAAVTSGTGTEEVTREPGSAAHAAKPGGRGPRAQRPADGRLPGNPSIHSAPKKQTSSELRTDDMFARKKRDNYLQKGLDLTANSSRRHVQKPQPENSSGNKASKAMLPTSSYQTGQGSAHRPPSAGSGSINPATAGPSRSMTTVLDLVSDAEDQKAEQRVTPDLECRDHSEGKMRRAPRRKGGSSKNRVNEAVIPDSQTGSDNSQKRRGNSEPAHAIERQSTSDLRQGGQIEDMGTISGTIPERLVTFGQKIIDSFWLLSAQTEAGVTERSSKKANVSHIRDVEYGRQVSEKDRGSAVQQGSSTLSVQTLSPRNIGQKEIHDLDRSDGESSDQRLSEVRCNAGKTKLDELGDLNYARGPTFPDAAVTEHTENNRPELATEAFPPSHGQRKRSLTTDTQNSMVEIDDTELMAGERNRKRAKLPDNVVAVAAGPADSSKSSRSDESRKAITEHAAGTKNGTRSLLASRRAKTTKTRAITRDAEANSSDQRSDGTERIRARKNSCRLTVPMGPTFSTDILRQQRLLAKPERDPEMREKDIGRKAKVSKSDDMNEGKGAKTGASMSNAQVASDTRESWKPTVPHAFRFETNIRQASRKQEFAAKLKTWEERASREASSSNHKLPDFKRRHVAQEAGLAAIAARRREMIAPTIPISPHFVVDIRLAERQKFEEVRRMKEAEAERIRVGQRRAREEEEEREWREARKRTVPRANAVPEWYSQVPKRTVQSR